MSTASAVPSASHTLSLAPSLMSPTSATAFAVGILLTLSVFLLPESAADERDKLKVGLQPDGRIVVPTNQILSPAGVQVTFPGRPVDVLAIEDGKLLVAKNMKGLEFID